MFTKLLTIHTSLELSIVSTQLEQNDNSKRILLCLIKQTHKQYVSSVDIQVSAYFYASKKAEKIFLMY